MIELTAKQQSFIEMIKTNDELAIKGFQLLLERQDYAQFFDVLQTAGLFAPTNNPAPVSGERENTVRIPFWAPLGYLKAVAERAGSQNDLPLAAKVLNVLRTVTAWQDEKGEPRRNYRTNRTFAEILGLLPTNVINFSDLDMLRQWLNDPYDRMLIADALDKGALPRLLNSGDPEDRKKAVRVLYHVTAITWQKDRTGSEPAPRSVVDEFWLEQLLKHHAKQIGAKAGLEAAEVMIERLREVFSTPTRRGSSSMFRPAVGDDAQNYQWRSVENCAVEGLRDVLLGWAETDPEAARAAIERMLTDNLQMIRRVGVYILARRWASMSDLYAATTVEALLRSGHSYELYHLLQDHFAEMNPEQQEATLLAIEGLPKPGRGDDPEASVRRRQHRWLSAIKGKGSPAADKRFADLDADPRVGKLSDHPDFDSYITTWAGPEPTPYSPDELVAFAQTNDLVDRLNKFTPSDDRRAPTTDGLTSALRDAARTSPDDFLASLPELLSTKAIYQCAVINGIKAAWEANGNANWDRGWEQLVSFFEQSLNDQHFPRQAEGARQLLVITIADCLRAGSMDDQHAYAVDLLPRTQAIIAFLMEQVPAADKLSKDPMTQALNTPKGRIIEALYSQVLRAARTSDRQCGNHRETWAAISPAFDAELAKCANANFEFSTLAGTYLPQLQYLDPEWIAERVEQIFPARYDANTICALNGLAYAPFTQQAYKLLAERGIVDRVLSTDLEGRDARGKLLERIGAAYLWGLEPLDGPILRKMFDTATTVDFETLIGLFWTVRNENLEAAQQERILRFAGRTLEWAQQQKEAPARLFATLSQLTSYIITLGRDERRLLEAVAPHLRDGYEAYEFIAELLRLAPQDPAAIATVLQSMISNHTLDYDYEDRLRSLLEYLAANGQREAVIVMTDRLRHLPGIETFFRNLTQR